MILRVVVTSILNSQRGMIDTHIHYGSSLLACSTCLHKSILEQGRITGPKSTTHSLEAGKMASIVQIACISSPC